MLRSVALGAALIAFAASGTVVHAADVGSYPDTDPFPGHGHTAKGHDWNGLYLGAHAGYGWGEWDMDLSHSSGAIHYNDPFDSDQVKLDGGNGWLGGLQAGYNHQVGSGLIGLEADVSWTDLDAEGTFFTATGVGLAYGPAYPYGTQWDIKSELDVFGTVRGRVGLAHGSVLLFATGGLAWGLVNTTQATTHPDPLPPADPSGTPGSRTSGTTNHIGYAAGAGAEWQFAKNWTLRAEYLFTDLGKTNYMLNGTTTPGGTVPYTETFAADIRLHSARIGVNYLFGDH